MLPLFRERSGSRWMTRRKSPAPSARTREAQQNRRHKEGFLWCMSAFNSHQSGFGYGDDSMDGKVCSVVRTTMIGNVNQDRSKHLAALTQLTRSRPPVRIPLIIHVTMRRGTRLTAPHGARISRCPALVAHIDVGGGQTMGTRRGWSLVQICLTFSFDTNSFSRRWIVTDDRTGIPSRNLPTQRASYPRHLRRRMQKQLGVHRTCLSMRGHFKTMTTHLTMMGECLQRPWKTPVIPATTPVRTILLQRMHRCVCLHHRLLPQVLRS